MQRTEWGPSRNGIEAMIDKACGAGPSINEDAAHEFIRFVWDYVWARLPADCFVFVEDDEQP